MLFIWLIDFVFKSNFRMTENVNRKHIDLPPPPYIQFPYYWHLVLMWYICHPKNPLLHLVLPSLSSHWTSRNHWSFYTLRSFVFSRMSYGGSHAALPKWLLSLSNMHLISSMPFHGLITHLYLAISNIPLFGCSIVYLSINLI